MKEHHRPELDGFSQLVGRLLTNPLPALIMLVAITMGLVALWMTPREEEPQIIVPLADVLITAPGLSAQQVERQVATPLENLLYQIDGVEHVYSLSEPGRSVVTVRFYVGEDREDSLVKIYNKIYSNTDQVPAAVSSWVVKPIEIDDVPMVLATLWSKNPQLTSDYELRRLAEEVKLKLQAIPNTNRVDVSGGRPRQIRVELNPQRLAARRTAPLEVAWAMDVSNAQLPAGTLQQRDEAFMVEAGPFIQDAAELEQLVINVVDGLPVYLKDVAQVLDGPAEPSHYSWIGFGPATSTFNTHTDTYPAVTISVAKEKGANAVWVAEDVKQALAQLQQDLFPPEVDYRIIRDYGRTADQKVGNLVASLAIAVLTVVIFIGLFLGWRAALVVGLAVPICYGVTLGLDFLTGYTVNRVTLFALILALGLLVDDPITGVDNIERYFRMGNHKPQHAIVLAIAEVRAPLIMSTLAIIAAFSPMFFITGMMGPYMAPMAFNVPVSVIVSTVVAFVVTPWLAFKLLRQKQTEGEYAIQRTFLYRIYNRLMGPLLGSRKRAWVFLSVVAIAFVISALLPMLRLVPLKLLPYDNKDEFQIVINMPEGTTLERTQGVAQAFGEYLRSVPEVAEFVAFVGTPSPIDFNGMVRHYYLREGNHFADLRVTLAPRQHRAQQSHEILLRIRQSLESIANTHGANMQLVEVPPGPPVISTVTVELYGSATTSYDELQAAAGRLMKRLAREPFVVDIDSSVEAQQTKLTFITDKEKAALSGIATEDIARTLALAIEGENTGFMQIPREANPLPIIVRLPLAERSSPQDLMDLSVKGRPGITKVREADSVRDAPQPLVQLGELGTFQPSHQDQTIYHKNLQRVVYVFAELAGRPPAAVVLDVATDVNKNHSETTKALWQRTYFNPGAGDSWYLPNDVRAVWSGEGEWDITLRVFRDLGIAFGVALLGIFVILMVQTGSATLAGIIMLAIPLTVIGIMPGFWLLNQLGERVIAGFPNPVLFTATAMIGMIALAGIVVRNSLILIEFIHLALKQGMSLTEALVQAGAIRMRPIFLTAATTLLGNLVITLDPIFSGLAWAIIFGIAASTLFTLAVIPVVYYLVYDGQPHHGVAQKEVAA